MSVSMLTVTPGFQVAMVVAPWVEGMMLTVRNPGPQSLTVRLTPSSATEPLGTT
jgi:hypothetical protein